MPDHRDQEFVWLIVSVNLSTHKKFRFKYYGIPWGAPVCVMQPKLKSSGQRGGVPPAFKMSEPFTHVQYSTREMSTKSRGRGSDRNYNHRRTDNRTCQILRFSGTLKKPYLGAKQYSGI